MTINYLERATKAIQSLGFSLETNTELPVLALLNKIQDVNETQVLGIGRVLQQSSKFNELVRDNIDASNYGTRYENITSAFTSIREDCQTMVGHWQDGKLSFSEKAAEKFMNFKRGTISDRYADIKKDYLSVSKDSGVQIDREKTILNAYADFRLALKQGQIDAQGLFDTLDKKLNEVKAKSAEASAALEAGDKTKAAEYAKLEMDRDASLNEIAAVEHQWQIAKDLVDNLKISYSTSDVVMARLAQTTKLKERVFQQSTIFFSTNETVFTGLNAGMTALAGLSESTRTLDAMSDGINKALEASATVGDAVLKDAIRAGYGPNIKAESVQKLLDAIVKFQEESVVQIKEMREASTKNADEVQNIVENGKKKFAALMQKA